MHDRWIDHAIWWHAYPLGFVGAERDALPDGTAPVHRLGRFEPWLDHLVGLGCSGLALGPVFASETHGYDTVDFFRIDPRLGDDGDFDVLVAAARERGIRILLDGVFNHVGRGFERFRAAQDGDADARRWFRWDGDRPADFEGHSRLVELNHDEPAVQQHVAAVMEHWLGRGADGWRLDAAYRVPPSFWRAVLPGVRERFPEAWFVGEVIHGDYPAIVAESGLDSVTQYELWKATWSALNDRNLFELAHALERHSTAVESFAPLTFLGNHDVTRLASRLDTPEHIGLAVAVLMTVGGVPSIYAGDEQGFTGVKEDREFGDDAVRPPFPDGPADLAPFGAPIQELHQRLIGLRRRHPWLVRARTTVEHLTNTTIAFRSSGGPGEELLTLLSVDDAAQRFPGVDDELPPHSWRVVGS
ncbi:alpha-amylase family protein [Pseudonocardia abyssalis]|uniref:Alpha-amylase family protein n=1 Tax=Pseudonocardia abyssalis TaxID=2792008 RepID=A0ABS6UTP6_9PSEU|nr:alpha-amylase family protein [Pseudonocardia abyssalis]MBW0118381.1 alpha-amylase family protein [Pseudonocardia abyssalis]MBW0135633.1 alpha-amylase family protein [Pseudonocardia abyssalis]